MNPSVHHSLAGGLIGREVIEGLNMRESIEELPSARILELVAGLDLPEADGIFVSCTGMMRPLSPMPRVSQESPSSLQTRPRFGSFCGLWESNTASPASAACTQAWCRQSDSRR